MTLLESAELRNLGLTFEKGRVTSPLVSTKIAKNKKIILKRVDRHLEDDLVQAFDCRRLSTVKNENSSWSKPHNQFASLITRKSAQAKQS